ncbi:MAG: hypothetical protein ACRD6N_18315, partial [Pyrinomonadaceae bacterium]
MEVTGSLLSLRTPPAFDEKIGPIDIPLIGSYARANLRLACLGKGNNQMKKVTSCSLGMVFIQLLLPLF